MKRILPLLILTLFAALFSSFAATEEKVTSATASATATPSPAENAEQVVTKLERDWADVIVKGDVAMIDRILADDFSYTNADGRIMTKTQHLEDIKSQAYKVESINLENLKVRVFGDAAVVTVGQMEKSQWKGKDSSGQYLFTDIYAKRNGKWQIVAGHGCKIAPQKPKASHFQVDDYLTDHRSPKEW